MTLGPFELEKGEAVLEIRGLGGLNAISTIYLASLEGLEAAGKMLAERSHAGLLDIILLLEEDSWTSEREQTLLSSPKFSGGSAIRFSGTLGSNFTTIWEDDYFILAKLEGETLSVSISIDGISLKEPRYVMEEPALQVYGPVRLKGGKHSLEISSKGEVVLDLAAISTTDPSSWREIGPSRMSYSGNPTSEYRFHCTKGMLVVHNIDHLNLWLPEGCKKIGDALEYGGLYTAENEGECALRYTPFKSLLPHFSLHLVFSSSILLIGLMIILKERGGLFV